MMLVIEIVKLTITRTNPKMIPEIDVQQKLKFKAISWGGKEINCKNYLFTK